MIDSMKPVYWMVECGHLGVLAPGWLPPDGLDVQKCPACGKATLVQAAYLAPPRKSKEVKRDA